MRKTTHFFAGAFALFSLGLMAAFPVLGQNDEAQERSRFLTYVEEQLSAPGRMIRLSGIDGALSSSATIEAITISDDEGVWLRIEQAAIDWNRSALFRGRLEIETLRAGLIDWPRMPLPPEGMPAPEVGRIALPELPVAVDIDALEIEEARLGEPLFGLEASLMGNGQILLEDGSLQTRFAVNRLDGPGGELALEASYAEASTQLAVDFSLTEPADGVVANLLNLEGRPPVSLRLQGDGPLDDLNLTLALDTDAGRVLSGDLTVRQAGNGRAFNAMLQGPISALIAPIYRDFFGTETSITASGSLPGDGGFQLDQLDIDSGALTFRAAARTAADGFLTFLQANGEFASADGTPLLLPIPGETTRAARGTIRIDFGQSAEANGAWSARVGLSELASGGLQIDQALVSLAGTSANLSDPTQRQVTFVGTGQAEDFSAEDPAVAQALGSSVMLDLAGAWRAGDPILLNVLQITGDALSAEASGSLEQGTFQGEIALDVRRLSPFAALIERPLTGALTLEADGSIDLLSGGFDLVLQGRGQAVSLGIAPIDRLFARSVRLQGSLARDEAGLRAGNLRLDGPQFELLMDGVVSSDASDLVLEAGIADLNALAGDVAGRAALVARVQGEDGPLSINVDLSIPQGRLVDQPLADGQLAFSGLYQDGQFTGRVETTATLGDAPLSGSTDIRVTDTERMLTDLSLETRGARLTGTMSQNALSGLIGGSLNLAATDIETLALLALLEARGAVDARVELTPRGAEQGVSAQGNARGLAIAGLYLGAANFDIDGDDLFGTPQITGRLAAEQLRYDDITVSQLIASSQASGSFSVSADGIIAPQLSSARLGSGSLRADGTYDTNAVSLSSATLTAGGVEATASGRVPLDGGSLALRVSGGLPLSLAEPFVADRAVQLSGTARFNVDVTGTLNQPQVNGQLNLADGQLVDPGSAVRLSGVSLNTRLTGQQIRVESARAQIVGGGSLAVSGTVGLSDGLPANLQITLSEARYADGDLVVARVDGMLSLTGPLAAGPVLGGTVRVLEANIQIPDSFGSAAGLVDVEHIAPSQRVRATFERARADLHGSSGGRSGPAIRLDVQVSAPNQIYVRGRGVSAELGGEVRLGGALNAIEPIGSFNLLRGRLDILGQRIALDEASITLIGDLDPFLNVVARTEGDAISVLITVRGRVSDPVVTLSSLPELPQDEVLARLIFDRGLSELSPLQIAQLALAANELAGNSDGSLLGDLRDSLGLSDIDVVTDEAGNPAVRATQYVQENVYLGVEASTGGSARTTINLDVTEDITTRGSVALDGESSLGIFFERDY